MLITENMNIAIKLIKENYLHSMFADIKPNDLFKFSMVELKYAAKDEISEEEYNKLIKLINKYIRALNKKTA